MNPITPHISQLTKLQDNFCQNKVHFKTNHIELYDILVYIVYFYSYKIIFSAIYFKCLKLIKKQNECTPLSLDYFLITPVSFLIVLIGIV